MNLLPAVNIKWTIAIFVGSLALASVGLAETPRKSRKTIPTKVRMVRPRRAAVPAKREAYLSSGRSGNSSLLAYSDRPVEQNKNFLLAPQPNDQKPILLFQTRPSWESETGKFFTDDLIEAGYQFNKNVSISYRQEFGYNAAGSLIEFEDGYRLGSGLIRAQFKNIFSVNRWSFAYEPRLYFPTDEDKRNQGMILSTRNYLKLSYTGERSNFHLWEVPIFHQYSLRGYTTETEKGPQDKANPYFENRLFLIWELGNGSQWNLWAPLMLRHVRYSDFSQTATNNDNWTYLLEIHPELMYQINSNVGMGIGYESGNFIKEDVLDVGNAFRTGKIQLIFQLSM